MPASTPRVRACEKSCFTSRWSASSSFMTGVAKGIPEPVSLEEFSFTDGVSKVMYLQQQPSMRKEAVHCVRILQAEGNWKENLPYPTPFHRGIRISVAAVSEGVVMVFTKSAMACSSGSSSRSSRIITHLPEVYSFNREVMAVITSSLLYGIIWRSVLRPERLLGCDCI